MRRLVLGARGAARRVVGVLSTWPGQLTAVVEDATTASAFADLDAVDTQTGDPTDPDAMPAGVESVYVAAGDTSPRVARAARERYPDAHLLVQCPPGTDTDLSAVADRVLHEGELVADAVYDAVTGSHADRLCRLRRVLTAAEEPVAVVAHDSPDPDAIGAALALVDIARSMGVEAVPYYAGEIGHQENRALVNLLELDLHRLEPGDAERFGGVVLVDHSRPGVNDSLDPDTVVDAVLDHHPPREPVSAPFVDLRPEVGATSTLLVEYLEGYGVEPSAVTATALLFGIRVDTRDFTREVSTRDFEAAAFLLPYVDTTVLDRVESPLLRPDVFDVLARAIEGRDVRGSALAAGVGQIRDKDGLAQAADFLVEMQGVDVVIVYGVLDDTVHVSGRARGGAVDLGETFREAFGQVGSAGGHADMAGAQIPLGVWADVEDAVEDLKTVVDDVVSDRFFETLETAPSALSDSDVAGMTLEIGRPDLDGDG